MEVSVAPEIKERSLQTLEKLNNAQLSAADPTIQPYEVALVQQPKLSEVAQVDL